MPNTIISVNVTSITFTLSIGKIFLINKSLHQASSTIILLQLFHFEYVHTYIFLKNTYSKGQKN